MGAPTTQPRHMRHKTLLLLHITAIAILSMAGCHCGPTELTFSCPTPPSPLPASHGNPNQAGIFDQEHPRYGCVGLVWDGQEKPPNGLIGELRFDGQYALYDPRSKAFVPTRTTPVPPGIQQATWRFFVMNVDAQEATKLPCTDYLRGGTRQCWDDPRCLFVYEAPIRLDAPPQDGHTCQLCQRELCNQKDDDCDGQIDEDDACGRIFAQTTCRAAAQAPSGPCASNKACECTIVTGSPSRIYLCAGAKDTPQQWTPLAQITAQCQDMNDIRRAQAYACGIEELLCDACPGQAIGWRSVNHGCSGGILQYKPSIQ